MYENRPRIKLKKTPFDRSLEISALVILVFLWLYILFSYRSLPGIIPAHYGMDGKVDRYDSKTLVFLLPAILTLVFILLIGLSRHPVKMNYPHPITEENAERQYRNSTRLLRVINLVIAIAFTFISVKEIHDSRNSEAYLDWWFIPALILGLLLPTVYYAWKSYKLK